MNFKHLKYLNDINDSKAFMNKFTETVKQSIVNYCNKNNCNGELNAKLDEDGTLTVSMPSMWGEFISSQRFLISSEDGIYVTLNFYNDEEHILGIHFERLGKVNIIEPIGIGSGIISNSLDQTLISYDYNDETLAPLIIEKFISHFII